MYFNVFENNLDLKNKNVFVTGATGSFGQAFVKYLLEKHSVGKLILFSRDELKQFEMQNVYPSSEYPNLRFFIGDVRDYDRLLQATKGVDIIVHAAALKQVIAMEYNPFECVQTNIIGAQNIVRAALENKVEKVLALSTDKAAEPINLYGASKLASDKIFVAANNLATAGRPAFSCVRYGNVINSRGSVVPFFRQLIDDGAETLPITHPNMTRFIISLEQGVQFVCMCLERMLGGELFIPKIASVRITDLATAMAPQLSQQIVGVRPGEKLHEVMLPSASSRLSLEAEKYYIIKPELAYRVYSPPTDISFRPVSEDFSYSSQNNEHFLSPKAISELLESFGMI